MHLAVESGVPDYDFSACTYFSTILHERQRFRRNGRRIAQIKRDALLRYRYFQIHFARRTGHPTRFGERALEEHPQESTIASFPPRTPEVGYNFLTRLQALARTRALVRRHRLAPHRDYERVLTSSASLIVTPPFQTDDAGSHQEAGAQETTRGAQESSASPRHSEGIPLLQ